MQFVYRNDSTFQAQQKTKIWTMESCERRLCWSLWG